MASTSDQITDICETAIQVDCENATLDTVSESATQVDCESATQPTTSKNATVSENTTSDEETTLVEHTFSNVDNLILGNNFLPKNITGYAYRGVIKNTDIGNITFIYVSTTGKLFCVTYSKQLSITRCSEDLVNSEITDVSMLVDIVKVISYNITTSQLLYVAPANSATVNYGAVKEMYILNKDESTIVNVYNAAAMCPSELRVGVYVDTIQAIYRFSTAYANKQVRSHFKAATQNSIELSRTNKSLSENLKTLQAENIQLVSDYGVITKQLDIAQSELICKDTLLKNAIEELAADRQKQAAITEKLVSTLKSLDIQY